MAKHLIFWEFQCLVDTKEYGSDEPCFLFFVGGDNRPEATVTVGKLNCGSEERIYPGKTIPVNEVVVENMDLMFDVVLVALLERNDEWDWGHGWGEMLRNKWQKVYHQCAYEAQKSGEDNIQAMYILGSECAVPKMREYLQDDSLWKIYKEFQGPRDQLVQINYVNLYAFVLSEYNIEILDVNLGQDPGQQGGAKYVARFRVWDDGDPKPLHPLHLGQLARKIPPAWFKPL